MYRVFSGGRFHPKDEGILLEFLGFEEVDPRRLSDQEAQLAGIDSAEELLRLFRRWYGSVPKQMWRNWFKVLKNGEGGDGMHCQRCGAKFVEFKTKWGWIMLCPKCDNPILRPSQGRGRT